MRLRVSDRSASRGGFVPENNMPAPSSVMGSFPPLAFSSSQSTSYHASGGSFASARAVSIFSISVACAVSSTAQAWLFGSLSLLTGALCQGVVASATTLWQHIVAFATICDANLQGENHAEANRSRRPAPQPPRHHPPRAHRAPAVTQLPPLS